MCDKYKYCSHMLLSHLWKFSTCQNSKIYCTYMSHSQNHVYVWEFFTHVPNTKGEDQHSLP